MKILKQKKFIDNIIDSLINYIVFYNSANKKLSKPDFDYVLKLFHKEHLLWIFQT